MKRGKTKAKRKPLAVVVKPVVGHLPDGFNPFAALYRVSLTCKVARDALDGNLEPTVNFTPSEFALFNICHALEDLATAMAFFNKPNPKVLRSPLGGDKEKPVVGTLN